MSETKFTKGEWFTRIVEEPFSKRTFISSKNDEGVMTLLETRSIANFEEQKANTFLISAAPEMFNALEELLSQVKQFTQGNIGEQDYFRDEISNAKKALNKAVGSVV